MNGLKFTGKMNTKMVSKVHSVIFEKQYYTATQARRKLKEMGFTPIKHVDITKSYLRYRIVDPNEFTRFITKSTGQGLKLVIGFT